MSEATFEFKNPSGRVAEISFSTSQEVQKGTEGKKYFVEANIHKGEKTRYTGRFFLKVLTSFFRNSFNNPETTMELYGGLKKVYERAVRNGEIYYIPLVPTLRINRSKILMTDMSEGGSKRVIDRHFDKEHFGRVEIKNIESLREEIETVRSVAAKNGYYVAGDAYSVVVDANGTGRAFLIDLGAVAKIDPGDWDSLQQSYRKMNGFLEFLDEVTERTKV